MIICIDGDRYYLSQQADNDDDACDSCELRDRNICRETPVNKCLYVEAGHWRLVGDDE